jgi:hypothetical protein
MHFTPPISLDFLRSNFIDDEEKNDVANHLQNKNAFELCYDFQAYGSWIQDSFSFPKANIIQH